MDRSMVSAAAAVNAAPSTRPDVVNYQRVTASGRTLRYALSFIQQPQRARACGAGAKASADRRPVDPPPILALNIYEVNSTLSETDITFQYQADIFTFVSLKSDRRYVQPRNMPSANSNDKQRELLAGQTVAAAAPYERPNPALYFVFPDLSVRHEGRYHLEFQMYERVKSQEDSSRGELHPDGILCPYGRSMINSEPFDVFSAKRFPGLTESTPLSRQLAEQGSRIRIRRDVRMRKQDTKGHSKNWDGYDDESNVDSTTAHLSRLPQTPDPYGQPRPAADGLQRPTSASSRGLPAGHDSLSRRTSLNDLSQPYLMHHHHQQQQQNQQSSQSQQVFAHQSAPYNGLQSQPYAQQSFMHPPPPQYASQAYQAPSAMMPQSQPNYYSYNSTSHQQQQPQQQQMPYPPITTPTDTSGYQSRTAGEYTALSNDSRRGSTQPALAPGSSASYAQPAGATQSQQQPYGHQSLYSDPAAQAHAMSMLPPQSPSADAFMARNQQGVTDTSRPAMRGNTPSPPSLHPDARNDITTKLPPLSTTVGLNKIEASSPISATTSYSGSVDSHKRPYGSTFSTNWQNFASKQGARPGDSTFASASMALAPDTDVDAASDTFDGYDKPVTYRRAGGSTATRTHI